MIEEARDLIGRRIGLCTYVYVYTGLGSEKEEIDEPILTPELKSWLLDVNFSWFSFLSFFFFFFCLPPPPPAPPPPLVFHCRKCGMRYECAKLQHPRTRGFFSFLPLPPFFCFLPAFLFY